MSGACLILGAGGRVGGLLRKVWDQATGGAPVLFQSRRPGPGIDLVHPLDTALTRQVSRPVSAVVVLAGITGGPDPAAFGQNTTLARRGAAVAMAIGSPALILASTAAVYSGGDRFWRETDPVEPRGDYGHSKRDMEIAATDWGTDAPRDVLCLRIGNVLGADALALAVGRATPEEPLCLDRFPDGRSPRRSWLTAATLAQVLAQAARNGVPAGVTVANLAEAGPSLEMATLLEARARAGYPVPWTWRDAPDTALPELALDTALIDRLYGLPPAPSPDALATAWIAPPR